MILKDSIGERVRDGSRAYSGATQIVPRKPRPSLATQSVPSKSQSRCRPHSHGPWRFDDRSNPYGAVQPGELPSWPFCAEVRASADRIALRGRERQPRRGGMPAARRRRKRRRRRLEHAHAANGPLPPSRAVRFVPTSVLSLPSRLGRTSDRWIAFGQYEGVSGAAR
jgi:hypothetical protein